MTVTVISRGLVHDTRGQLQGTERRHFNLYKLPGLIVDSDSDSDMDMDMGMGIYPRMFTYTHYQFKLIDMSVVRSGMVIIVSSVAQHRGN